MRPIPGSSPKILQMTIKRIQNAVAHPCHYPCRLYGNQATPPSTHTLQLWPCAPSVANFIPREDYKTQKVPLPKALQSRKMVKTAMEIRAARVDLLITVVQTPLHHQQVHICLAAFKHFYTFFPCLPYFVVIFNDVKLFNGYGQIKKFFISFSCRT
jgi:hypothetical protein